MGHHTPSQELRKSFLASGAGIGRTIDITARPTWHDPRWPIHHQPTFPSPEKMSTFFQRQLLVCIIYSRQVSTSHLTTSQRSNVICQAKEWSCHLQGACPAIELCPSLSWNVKSHFLFWGVRESLFSSPNLGQDTRFKGPQPAKSDFNCCSVVQSGSPRTTLDPLLWDREPEQSKFFHCSVWQ